MNISSYILLAILIGSISCIKTNTRQGFLSFLQAEEIKHTEFVSSSCGEVCITWPDVLPEATKEIMNRAQPVAGKPDVDFDNPCQENVKRVARLLPKDKFEYLFPKRNAVYLYEDLLTAIAKFPFLCNDVGPLKSDTSFDDMCMQELSGIFAHFTQETGGHSDGWESSEGIAQWRQGLYFLEEICGSQGTCPYTDNCNDGGWAADAYKCVSGASYYGRGAKQLTWNYNYGPFSRVMFGDVDELLENPNRIAEEGWLALAGAVWFYMTPQTPKPSMHDTVVGHWEPNSADTAAGIEIGFGTTINIINGAIECRGGSESQQAAYRQEYFQEFMNYFGVDIPSTEQLTCGNMKAFPDSGTGYIESYWDQSWSAEECKLVPWQTQWNVLFPEDFDICSKNYYPSYTPKETGGETCFTPEGDPNGQATSTVSETVTETVTETIDIPETPSQPTVVEAPVTVSEEIDC